MSHNFNFNFVITTITPLTTLIILVTSTQHAHLTSRVSLRSTKRPSAQFANSINNKFSTNKVLQPRIYEQSSTIPERPSSVGVLQPYFISNKGISRTSFHRGVLNRLGVTVPYMEPLYF